MGLSSSAPHGTLPLRGCPPSLGKRRDGLLADGRMRPLAPRRARAAAGWAGSVHLPPLDGSGQPGEAPARAPEPADSDANCRLAQPNLAGYKAAPTWAPTFRDNSARAPCLLGSGKARHRAAAACGERYNAPARVLRGKQLLMPGRLKATSIAHLDAPSTAQAWCPIAVYLKC